jgi:hypothetical protein
MSLPSIQQILLPVQRKRRDSLVDEMDLNNLLNTNRSGPSSAFRNMQYEVALPINMNHDMSATPHYAQQNLYVPNGNNRIKSETGSERGVSPHTSDPSSRYSSQTPQTSLAYQQIANQLSNGMRYPSPSQLQQSSNMPLIQHPHYSTSTPDNTYQPQTHMGAVQPNVPQDQSPMEGGRTSTGSSSLPKAFACATCSKGFARRSDLARHGKSKLK